MIRQRKQEEYGRLLMRMMEANWARLQEHKAARTIQVQGGQGWSAWLHAPSIAGGAGVERMAACTIQVQGGQGWSAWVHAPPGCELHTCVHIHTHATVQGTPIPCVCPPPSPQM